MFASSFLAGLLAVQLVNSLPFPLGQQQELLRAHNDVRTQTYEGKMMCGGGQMCPKAQKTSAPLVWDDTLAGVASKHADVCTFGHSSTFFGENLYSMTGATQFTNASLYNAVYTKWSAEEARNWRYTTHYGATHSGTTTWGHFTQVVWQNTEWVGCGFAKCTFGMFLVCNYASKGNIGSYEVYRPLVYPTKYPTLPPTPTKAPTPRPTTTKPPSPLSTTSQAPTPAQKTTSVTDSYNLHSAVATARYWGYNVTYPTSCVTFRGLAERYPYFRNKAVTHPYFVVKPLTCTSSKTSYVNFGLMQLWIQGAYKYLKFEFEFHNTAYCISDTLAGCDGKWLFRNPGDGQWIRPFYEFQPNVSARWGCPQNPGEYNVVAPPPATTTAQNAPNTLLNDEFAAL